LNPFLIKIVLLHCKLLQRCQKVCNHILWINSFSNSFKKCIIPTWKVFIWLVLLTTNTNSISRQKFICRQCSVDGGSDADCAAAETSFHLRSNRGIFHFWNEKLIFVSSALTKCFGFYLAFGLSVWTKKRECRQSWPAKNNKRQQPPIIGCFNGFNSGTFGHKWVSLEWCTVWLTLRIRNITRFRSARGSLFCHCHWFIRKNDINNTLSKII